MTTTEFAGYTNLIVTDSTKMSSSKVSIKTTFSSVSDDVSGEGLIISNLLINVVLNNVLCFLGIVGNIINIIVLSRPKFRDTTSFLLLCVSVADFFVSVIQLIFRLPNVIMYFKPRVSDVVFCFYMTYLFAWNSNFVGVSVYLVSLVAVERMIAICFPFHVTSLVTMFRVRILAFFGFIFYPVLYAPFLNMLSTVGTIDRNNITGIRLEYTDFFIQNYDIIFFYRFVVTLLLYYGLPMVLILFCTFMIIHSMAMNWKNLQQLSSINSTKRLKEMKSAKSVLYVCFSMMVIILIPSLIFDTLSWFRGDLLPQNKNRSTIIYYIMSEINEINSFFNFIIYVATSSKFAREFKYVFLCMRKNQPLKDV